MFNTTSRWLIAGAGLLAALAPSGRARAGQDSDTIATTVVGLLVPSDVGITAFGLQVGPRPVIGWSLQIPIGSGRLVDAPSHRIVPAIELLPWAGDTFVRGRLGYRCTGRDLFAGASVGVDRAGMTLSPEFGVKFAHAFNDNIFGFDSSMHLLARADVAPESGHVRAATLLLGWNFI